MAGKKSRLITAAIDFGTTFSGYAYGFKCDIEKEPPTIITNQWSGGRTISHKSPTSVLFNPDKTFNSFGYNAEEKYAEVCAEEMHRSYYYFRRFKMLLHGTKTFSKTMTIAEEDGKTMPAMDVFAAGISYMKQHLLDAVRKKVSSVCEDDVLWVLTVPAIWRDPAKVFMREAAEKAGIAHEQLIIALEPESASVYCQRIPTERMVDTAGVKLQIADTHSKFMVCDLGGGTADITCHEREANGTLKELYKASGGAWGGTKVDAEFIKLLKMIFLCACETEKKADEVFRLFKDQNMEDYVDLLREFEMKKRDAKLDSDTKVTIKLPVSLHEVFEEATDKKLKDIVQKTKFGDKISVSADKMRIHTIVMRSLFKPAIDSIVNHLEELFKLPDASGIDTVLLVGGFSGSCLIQEAIRKKFTSKKLYIPGEPDMAVLMGAVLFGNNPKVISFRKSRFTYGVSTNERFRPNQDPEDKKRLYDNVVFCCDRFTTIVKVNQVLKVGEPTAKRYLKPVRKNQTTMDLPIYAAADKSPNYVTDTGCQYLGSVSVDMPDTEGGTERDVEVRVNFAGTELEVEALEKKTMKTYKTRVNFLD